MNMYELFIVACEDGPDMARFLGEIFGCEIREQDMSGLGITKTGAGLWIDKGTGLVIVEKFAKSQGMETECVKSSWIKYNSTVPKYRNLRADLAEHLKSTSLLD